jgi:hypothetical protein
MDSVSSPEVAEIFDRLSLYTDMQGATNAAAIEHRLLFVRQICKFKAKMSKRLTTRARYGYRTEQLDKLIEKGFPERAIVEANRYPKGIISLTLRYGRQEAKRILAQRRAAVRLAYPRAGVRYQLPARVPERRVYIRPRVGRR